jgi:2,4-dienoyl-CoA reductase-like NADH-dependent reductase (Old Yellow Enzyme family)
VVDIPVMVGGLLDDALLADSVIRDGGADLIAVGARMRVEPGWPHHAHAILAQREALSD